MPPGGVWRENEGVVIRFPRGIGSAGVLGVLPGVRRGEARKTRGACFSGFAAGAAWQLILKSQLESGLSLWLLRLICRPACSYGTLYPISYQFVKLFHGH